MAVVRSFAIAVAEVNPENINVELSLGKNNIYEAQVVEIHDKKALISFNNSYYPNREVLLKDIWYAPTCRKEVVDYQENLEVDGYFRVESLNHQVWIQGTISTSENGGHLFTYQNNEEQIATVSLNDLTYLRPRHVGQTLDSVTFYTVACKVSTLVHQYIKIETLLEFLRKRLSCPLVFYKDDEETLCFVTSQRKIFHRAVLLCQDFLMFVTRVMQMRESCQSIVDYVGQSIDAEQTNLLRARGIAEVCHINISYEKASSSIFGMNEEAVEEAESLLQYSRKYYVIPKKYLGQLVGKGFANFTKIVEKSGAASLHLPLEANYDNLGIPPQLDGDVAVVISGQPPAIEKAMTLISYQLDYIQQKTASQNYLSVVRQKFSEKLDILAATLGTSRQDPNELQSDSDDDDSSTTSSDDTSTDDELPKFDENEYLHKVESFEEDENFEEVENLDHDVIVNQENFSEDVETGLAGISFIKEDSNQGNWNNDWDDVGLSPDSENLTDSGSFVSNATSQQSFETGCLLEMASAKLATIFDESD